MSTSDQEGNQPLTRKQLREIRLTGATPVITEEEAAAAVASPAAAAPAPSPAEPVDAPRPDADVDPDETPLTRRQVREQERIRTASVPVIVPEEEPADAAEPAAEETDEAEVDEIAEAEAEAEEPTEAEEIVSGVPVFTPADETPVDETAADETSADDILDDDAPSDEVPVEVVEVVTDEGDKADADADDDISELGIDAEDSEDSSAVEDSSVVDDPIAEGERPVVSPTFGTGLLKEQDDVPEFTPSFDELITSDSGGSQNIAPNTLIFNPSLGNGSLSGPVASTGELLVTGSYDLPRGIGSHGHAHGTADGKEADAVLIDGELPPSSSPTPIAASSAISTTKPAGEVIRPPAPEKGNKLMLTLAITAGGLAIALAVVLIVAFTTNVV